MAVLKNTVQVNNGNTGWNAGHVMDALEEVFGDLGWNSGTQKNGVPQSVRSPQGTVVEPGVHWAKGAADSFEHAAPAIPLRAEKTVYYDIHANSTNDAYRLARRFYVGSNELDVTANTITQADHQLSTGDAVKYGYGLVGENATNKIPELTFGTTYYVIKVDNNTFKLAASSSDALTSLRTLPRQVRANPAVRQDSMIASETASKCCRHAGDARHAPAA